MYTRNHDFFGSSSATTSTPYFVGDFASLSMGIGSASTVTVWGSNSDGFTAVIPEADWSVVSTVVAAGVQKIETGFRWMRVYRSQSSNTIRSQGQVRE